MTAPTLNPSSTDGAAITVRVNGELQTTAVRNLRDWVEAKGVMPEAIATAVNGQFVPRSARAECPLAEGDAILTFQPIAGG